MVRVSLDNFPRAFYALVDVYYNGRLTSNAAFFANTHKQQSLRPIILVRYIGRCNRLINWIRRILNGNYFLSAN